MFTEHFFKRACGLTIGFTLMLFVLGGFVRVTKSGMGCPDWPTCFGSWIPPMSEADCPPDYKDQFRDQRLKKVKRMVSVLKSIGMTKKAEEIEQNKDILVAHDYSFRTMVTEYTNRLFGAATGIFAFLTLISAFQFTKSQPKKLLMVIGGLIFIGFNGWLGSIVVDTNLLQGVVTSHFILAFIALAFFMIAYNYGSKTIVDSNLPIRKVRSLSWILFIGITLQIIGGTTVRELVDSFVKSGSTVSSDLLITASFEYNSFMLHKIFPFALLALVIGILVYIKRTDKEFNVKMLVGLLAVFFLQGLSGSFNLLTGNSVPSQLLHVALGGLVFAFALQWMIQLHRTRISTNG